MGAKIYTAVSNRLMCYLKIPNTFLVKYDHFYLARVISQTHLSFDVFTKESGNIFKGIFTEITTFYLNCLVTNTLKMRQSVSGARDIIEKREGNCFFMDTA
jgi:hypothetical protein